MPTTAMSARSRGITPLKAPPLDLSSATPKMLLGPPHPFITEPEQQKD